MIKISCKCGHELTVADPGEATCPDCDTLYAVSDSKIGWSSTPEWITLPAAAKRFNIPLPTLRYHAVQGSFEAYKPDKRTWLAEASSVEEWAKERSK